MKKKECITCSYVTKTSCLVFKERQANCTAWADKIEKERREKAIEDYIGNTLMVRAEESIVTREKNKEKRNGLSVQQALNKDFMKLYKKNYSDVQISDKLHISRTCVRLYRLEKGLEQQGTPGRKKACGNRQIKNKIHSYIVAERIKKCK